ncbi:MBG domain-containing protein [Prevotella falsenii]|uniref:MBG domain-containing protein n=1 Tax=Prevotella falsenii TaxID=515414 RepID=UPI00357130C0
MYEQRKRTGAHRPSDSVYHATEASPAGEYDLVISGGEAQNYKFSYKNGKLTILTVAGIDHANASDTATPQTVYSVSGAKVGTTASLSSLPRGVYIVNKKKVVVK